MSFKEKEIFTSIWQIENFSMQQNVQACDPIDYFRSPTFKVDFLQKTEWYLYLEGAGPSGNEYRTCCLEREEDYIDKVINFSFTFTALSMFSEKNIRGEIVTNVCDDGWDMEPKTRMHTFDLDETFNSENGLLPNDTLTIVCHMWKPKHSNENLREEDLKIGDAYVLPSTKISCGILKHSSKTNQLFARTRVEVRSEFALWSIERFSELQPGVKVRKVIHFGRRGWGMIQLILDLSIESDADSTICIKVHLRDNNDTIDGGVWPNDDEYNSEFESVYGDILVRGKLKTLGSPKSIQQQGEIRYYFGDDKWSKGWKFRKFMKRKDLVESKYLSYTDDVLYFCCEFSCSVNTEVYNFKDGDFEFPVFCPKSGDCCCCSDVVVDPLRFHGGMFSDAILRAGTKEFKVQKSLMCMKSDVFRDMFESEIREKGSGIVDITDIEPDVLDRMLSFMYTDKLEGNLNYEDISRLYCAADKYKAVSLKYRCCCVLMSTLSVFSVCHCLILSDTHHDVDLFQSSRSFIHMNTKKVFYSQNWRDLITNYPLIAVNIMLGIVTNTFLK